MDYKPEAVVLPVADVGPAHAEDNSFAEFSDPDGNLWVLQERG